MEGKAVSAGGCGGHCIVGMTNEVNGCKEGV